MAPETTESLWVKIKAKPLVSIGRLIFAALLMTQSGFLGAYLAAYRDGAMAVLCILCIPVLLSWIYCLSKEAGLLGMVFTWGLYLVVF